jgi:hypothetical protein
MNYLKRISEICTVAEAAEFLRFSFSNALETAEQRRQDCEKAGDQDVAAFWEAVRLKVHTLEHSKKPSCGAEPN